VREIVVDTETTGLDCGTGHRVVEIGCVELRGGGITGRVWQSYFNPERDVPREAIAIHGLTEAFLRGAPLFKERASDLLAFMGGAKLVAHNAPFDLGFLNTELSRCALPSIIEAVDTLDLVRRKLPGQRHTLDALCDRFGVCRAGRGKHGALLDAQLLAEVYVRLTGQAAVQLALDFAPGAAAVQGMGKPLARAYAFPSRLSAGEIEAHRRFIDALGAPPLWDRFDKGGSSRSSKR
jgi:DNA polymerase-3 subunit epsilon